MTPLQHAAQQVLRAVDKALPYAPYLNEFDVLADTANDLRAALAQQTHGVGGSDE